MRSHLLYSLGTCIATLLLLSTPAQAQQNPANEIARMEVRFTELDEKLRTMQGRIEEVEYENRRMRELLDRYQQDTNLRVTELENAKPIVAPTEDAEDDAEEEAPAAKEEKAAEKPAEQPKAENSTFDGRRFSNARAHYDYAFGLLNQTQYAKAGEAFEAFIKTYPKDPLIGHAYYWTGETYYVRQNYTQAIDFFRQGFEALPGGPKAGDNLLKLGMALNNLQRSTEACVVLKQVIAKFSNSPSIKGKAEQERNRAGCK